MTDVFDALFLFIFIQIFIMIVFSFLFVLQVRVEVFQEMARNADQYVIDRRHLEGAEGGRRQKEGLVYPKKS